MKLSELPECPFYAIAKVSGKSTIVMLTSKVRDYYSNRTKFEGWNLRTARSVVIGPGKLQKIPSDETVNNFQKHDLMKPY